MRKRNSLRLTGYDYSGEGAYFVTIRTAQGRCIFGEVRQGQMCLSEMGRIADLCFRKIPEHTAHARIDALQVMPNHVHGVIIIKRTPVGV